MKNENKFSIMKSYMLYLLAPLLLFSSSCKKEEPSGPKEPQPITLTAKGNEVIARSNGFGIELFRVTATNDAENMMLSPLSASTALTMLLNGCNADTYDQIRDMLGYDGLTISEINEAYHSLVGQLLTVDPEIQLALANAVWYRQDFMVKQEFLDTMGNSFDSEIGALDFSQPSALETINGWASNNTNGKIPKVLNEIDPDAVMFLMNALYFKGNWTYQFEPDQTEQLPFHLENGSSVNVDMMKGLIAARTYAGNSSTAIELTYGQHNFSMVIILPEGTLSTFLPGFDETDWVSITSGLDALSEPTEMEVVLPKFKFEYEKYLNDQLKALGMTDAFNPMLADLSGITDASVYVNFVKQNTFVDVNEEGTEAAAVTTIGIYETSMPDSFLVDKPFIFAIRERMTNTLLFIGKMELPYY